MDSVGRAGKVCTVRVFGRKFCIRVPLRLCVFAPLEAIAYVGSIAFLLDVYCLLLLPL
jgi:hypothetical protein